MKVKITEQQIKGLFCTLQEQDSSKIPNIDINQVAPGLSKLAKLFANGESSSFDTTKTNNQDSSQFAKDIPLDDEPMHPLGHKEKITSSFGIRNSSIGSKNHKGIDIAAPSGSPVYAPLDGKVITSKDTTPNSCGGFIQLNHGKIQTKFCHLRDMVVKNGEEVKKGQLIGYSGGGQNDPYRGTSTGPHLHYEIIDQSGIAMNPTNVQHNLA